MAKLTPIAPEKSTFESFEVTVELSYRAKFTVSAKDAKAATNALLQEVSAKQVRKRAKREPSNIKIKSVGRPVRLLTPVPKKKAS